MTDFDSIPPLDGAERADDDVMAMHDAADWLAFQRDLESDWRL